MFRPPVFPSRPSQNWADRLSVDVVLPDNSESLALRCLANGAYVMARTALGHNELLAASAALDRLPPPLDSSALALHLRAEIAIRSGDYTAAVLHLEKIIRGCPEHVATLHSLAYCHFMLLRFDRARQFADQSLALNPTNLPARLLRAGIAASAGDNVHAVLIYQGVVAEYPDHVPSLLGLGHSLKIIGKTSHAIAAYRDAVALAPHSGEAWASLAALKTYRFSDQELDAMTSAAKQPDLPPSERCQLGFALGKAYSDRRNYEQSFVHYAQSNAWTRANSRDKAESFAAELNGWVDDSIAAFTGRCATVSDAPFDPIFIVGLPRSGSTLVEQMLGSHSQVEAAAELPYIHEMALRLMRQRTDLHSVDLDELAREYLACAGAHRKTRRRYLIDKLTINFRHIALIRALFPSARIVDVRRHPLGNVVGMFRQNFVNFPEYSGSLGEIALARRDYDDTMRKNNAAHGGQIYTLRYEALVQDTDAQVRSLLDWMELPFEAACLEWFNNGQNVRTPSSEQVRQPIFRHGLSDWQNYTPWLADARAILTAELATYESDRGVAGVGQ